MSDGESKSDDMDVIKDNEDLKTELQLSDPPRLGSPVVWLVSAVALWVWFTWLVTTHGSGYGLLAPIPLTATVLAVLSNPRLGWLDRSDLTQPTEVKNKGGKPTKPASAQ